MQLISVVFFCLALWQGSVRDFSNGRCRQTPSHDDSVTEHFSVYMKGEIKSPFCQQFGNTVRKNSRDAITSKTTNPRQPVPLGEKFGGLAHRLL